MDLKVELGGGPNPRPGYTSIDIRADSPPGTILLDLEQVGNGVLFLPFENDTVGSVYSSHCLEHVVSLVGVWREIARICRVGAGVEIRVPHWGSDMAFTGGHVHAISETQMRHVTTDFLPTYFPADMCAKRLRMLDTVYIPDQPLQEARGLFPQLNDTQIMRFIQGTCHEIRYIMDVIPNT